MTSSWVGIMVALMLSVAAAEAKELDVRGLGSVAVTEGSPLDVKLKATREAKRNAVMAAMNRILGSDASHDPRVAAKIDAVVDQVADTTVVKLQGNRIENSYQVQIHMILDDKTFRTLLLEHGLANLAPLRANSVLAIMDEFVTTPRELKVQREEPVKFQPSRHTAEKLSKTYNALLGELQDYDLRIIDNDLFRSRFFADAITLEALANRDVLARYVGYARKEAKADFLLVGTSIIDDLGKDVNTGESKCSGQVSVKTFSTQSGESIASDMQSEVASGMDSDGCAANLASKLARVVGAEIGARIQDYWQRRITFGREYMLTLRSPGLALRTRMEFTKAIKGLPGVENVTPRYSTDTEIELTVTYKGRDALDQVVIQGLSGNPACPILDSVTDGTHIRFCSGRCTAQR